MARQKKDQKPAAAAGNGNGKKEERVHQGATLRDLLESRQAALQALVPKHLNASTLVNLALAVASRDQKLAKCTPASILRCVIQATELGLRFGESGQAYMVPRWNKHIRCNEATFQTGYRGLIDLMTRGGKVAGAEARLVYERDEFQVDLGTDPKIVHRPHLAADRGDVVAAYSVITRPDGFKLLDVMSRDELDKVRDQHAPRNASGALTGPWTTHQGEQQRKTVLRRNSKYAPLSVEAEAALAMEDTGVPQLTSGAVVDIGAAFPEDTPPGGDGGGGAAPSGQAANVRDKLKQAKDRAAAAAPDPAGKEEVPGSDVASSVGADAGTEPASDPPADAGSCPHKVVVKTTDADTGSKVAFCEACGEDMPLEEATTPAPPAADADAQPGGQPAAE